jgi:hypothetical protein
LVRHRKSTAEELPARRTAPGTPRWEVPADLSAWAPAEPPEPEIEVVVADHNADAWFMPTDYR